MKIILVYGFIWNDNNIKCLYIIFIFKECIYVCILIVLYIIDFEFKYCFVL